MSPQLAYEDGSEWKNVPAVKTRHFTDQEQMSANYKASFHAIQAKLLPLEKREKAAAEAEINDLKQEAAADRSLAQVSFARLIKAISLGNKMLTLVQLGRNDAQRVELLLRARSRHHDASRTR